jgi:Rrf2 family protein
MPTSAPLLCDKPASGAGPPLELLHKVLTKKAKYGLKALVRLAKAEPGRPALVADVAEAEQIPKKFLDAILGELRNAGFVHSKKGKGGGYALARPAKEISIGAVIRVLDGPLAPIPCASKTVYRRCDDCVDEQHCAVRMVMLQVREAIAGVLDKTTLEEMRVMGDVGVSGAEVEWVI